MRPLRTLVALVLPAFLASCYISQTPLVTADKAVFPFETIAYKQGDDEKVLTMKRQGDVYIQINEKGEPVETLFMPVKDDFYVVQLRAKTAQGDFYLYGLIKYDPANKTAGAYAVMGEKADIEAGMPACPDGGGVCLTDIKAYADHALTKTGEGKKADMVYAIQSID